MTTPDTLPKLSERQHAVLLNVRTATTRVHPTSWRNGSFYIQTVTALVRMGLLNENTPRDGLTTTERGAQVADVILATQRAEEQARSDAEAVRCAERDAAAHAVMVEVEPALMATATKERPQRVDPLPEEPPYTEQAPGMPPRVLAHVEITARIVALEDEREGSHVRISTRGRIEELERVRERLVALSVIEAPVPVSEDELGLICLAEDGPRATVRVGDVADERGRWSPEHEGAHHATPEKLVALWRRDLVAYAGGGMFKLTERGWHAYAQSSVRLGKL